MRAFLPKFSRLSCILSKDIHSLPFEFFEIQVAAIRELFALCRSQPLLLCCCELWTWLPLAPTLRSAEVSMSLGVRISGKVTFFNYEDRFIDAGFILACEDFRRRFNHSFATCAFFSLSFLKWRFASAHLFHSL